MFSLDFKPSKPAIEYTLTHRPRVTKRLHMEIDDHGSLVIVAPRHWSNRQVDATVAQNAARIERFLVAARQRQLAPLRYVDGGQHLYLGRHHTLRVRPGTGKRARLELCQAELQAELVQTGPEQVKRLLSNWYRQRAEVVFAERLTLQLQQAQWTNGRQVPLVLRRMKRSWGNCSAKGLIKLNTHLIKAPLTIIDSVIAHELCHLEEMNHGPEFYALLHGLNPGWREDRSFLRSNGFRYLQE